MRATSAKIIDNPIIYNEDPKPNIERTESEAKHYLQGDHGSRGEGEGVIHQTARCMQVGEWSPPIFPREKLHTSNESKAQHYLQWGHGSGGEGERVTATFAKDHRFHATRILAMLFQSAANSAGIDGGNKQTKASSAASTDGSHMCKAMSLAAPAVVI